MIFNETNTFEQLGTFFSIEDLRKRLREELKEDLRAISGGGDTVTPTGQKPSRQQDTTSKNTTTQSADKIDHFELVFECIHTRPNFLNIISLSSSNSVEPDIDLVILQALLKG